MLQQLQDIQQEIQLIKNHNPFFYQKTIVHNSFEIKIASLIEYGQTDNQEIIEQSQQLINLWEEAKNDVSSSIQLDIQYDEIEEDLQRRAWQEGSTDQQQNKHHESWKDNRDHMLLEITAKINKQFNPIIEENTKQLKTANKEFKQLKTLFNQHKEQIEFTKIEEIETDINTATSSYLQSKRSLEKLKTTIQNLSHPDKLYIHFYTIGRLNHSQNPQEYLTEQEEGSLNQAFQKQQENRQQELEEKILNNQTRIQQQVDRGDITQSQADDLLEKITESLQLSVHNNSRNSHFAGRKYAKQQLEEFYQTISPMIQIAVNSFQEDLSHFNNQLQQTEETIRLTINKEQ